MKTVLFLLAIIFSSPLQAQIGLQRTYSTGGTDWNSSVLPATTGTVIAGYNTFNFDSSWLHLVFLNNNGDVTSEKSWRATIPLSFMDNAKALTNGYLMDGIGSPNLGDFHPFLIKTDNSGNVQWSKWFDNLAFSSHQLNAIVPDGNNFTVYSYPDGATEGFYRIEGDESGSSFSATAVTYSGAGASMRISNAIPFSTVSDHLLTGFSYYTISGNGTDALLIKMAPASISWSKLFHLGSQIAEEFDDAVISAGDNPIVVGFSQSDSTSIVTSFVMKLSASGSVTWCKQLALGNICELFSILETSSGDLFVCGINSSYEGILVKLTSTGDLTWAKKWTPSDLALTYFTDLHQDPVTNGIDVSGTHNGAFMLLHLDADGNGCEFDDLSTLTVTDFAPVVLDLPLMTTPFVLTTQTETLYDRSSVITTQDICETGIPQMTMNKNLVITPNPASDVLSVTLPVPFTHATVNFYDITGRIASSFSLTNPMQQIPISILQPGIYMVEIICGSNNWKQKVIIE